MSSLRPKLLLIYVIIILSLLSLSSANRNNLTLSGDALFVNSSLSLTSATSSSNCSSRSSGSAFYPVPFKNSFSSLFKFRILSLSPSSSPCPFGDGLAFFITSKFKNNNVNGKNSNFGYMGFQELDPKDPLLAIEFDTSFNPNLGDFSSSHVGIDLNSVVSVSVAAFPLLKTGRQITAWVEYQDLEKTVKVWVWLAKEEIPDRPLVEYRVDLSRMFSEFMHVGFSASNSLGSALHLVDTWRFRTYDGMSSDLVETMENSECYVCDEPEEEGEGNEPDAEKNDVFGHIDNRVDELALGLGGLAAFVISICSVFCVVVLCLMRRRKVIRIRNHEGPKRLTLSEIRSATKGFSHKRIIGKGGTATVYEGVIPSFGSVVVKRFKRVNQTSPFRDQFSTEFATMVGFFKHKHLVELRGWCCEGSELVLVYEFMSNGSLDRVLHNSSAISGLLMWERRLSIILGVGSALIYLHEQCERQIIHRDVKTCNVMLDEEFNPKLGDFGLAEVYNHSSVLREPTIPVGTVGYLAPEYVYTGVPTVKTDVYSYGVVVLEVVTGLRPVVDKGVMLADRMWDLWEKGQLIEAADLKMRGKFKRGEVERVLMVGLCCVHPNFEERPTVKEAVSMMRGEVVVPFLPPRKPRVRIQSVLPEGSREIMSLAGDENIEDTPWLTPRTHF